MKKIEAVLLTKREVALVLRISERTLERCVAAERVPKPLALGGRRLWRRDELLRWIRHGCPSLN